MWKTGAGRASHAVTTVAAVMIQILDIGV